MKTYKLKKSNSDIVETTERKTIQAKHTFTAEEKRELADKMAQRQTELVEKNQEKKTVMSGFKDTIARINLDISKLSRGYRDGWEYRDFEVIVCYDYFRKEKIYKDVSTGLEVDRQPFAPGDEQRKIPV